jgi:uncharacterized protein GlcG (DUF336 family)
MKLKTDLSLAAATRIVELALEAGRTAGMRPLTVAVLDAGGHPVALAPEIATGKAWGALGMGESSRALGARLRERVAFQAALAAASGGRVVAVPGGVLIRDGAGLVIGAVGISGDTSEKDEYCAIEGIRAAGLTPEPAEPDPNWQGDRG